MNQNNDPCSSSRLRVLFILAGFVLLAGLLGVRGLGNLSVNAAGFIPLYLFLFVPYLAAIWFVHRRDDCVNLTHVMAFAVVFRLLLLPGDPTLSDDVYRYIHDGVVQGNGINPYLHPPSEVPGHDARINNPDIRTVYPPVMQVFFFLITRISTSVFAMKTFMVLCDLALCFVLLALLRARGLPDSRVVYYAWNPLVLIETASSGHNDVVSLLFLMIALLLFQRNNNTRARIGGHAAMALSILSKAFTLPLWPVFLRRRMDWTLLSCPLLVLAVALPYALGGNLFDGLLTFGRHWHFNDSIFALLKSSWVFGTKEAARPWAILLFVIAYVWILYRQRDEVHACASLLGLMLVMSPTVHPWYVTWIVPFLALRPRASWLMLTALVILAYHIRIGWELHGVWEESVWIKWIEYAPFYIVWGLEQVWDRLRAVSLRDGRAGDNT